MQHGLLRRFGSPAQVLAAAPPEIAQFAGDGVASALARGADERLVERTLRWLDSPGRHLIALGEAAYPPALLESGDPPTLLYAMGRPELLQSPCFAIVGSRNATPQGRVDAQAFARAMSDAGLCIVSGLALGVDAAAHRGGLEGRSSSVAVMGTGADIFYPRSNRELAQRLAEAGCVATEFCLGTPSAAGNFPRRNRLISGLARGVLVVEANARSGSLITARLAADQGRDVFAIPGSIHSPLSKGCHKLIKEGAKLVENADDILVELGMGPAPERARRPEAASAYPLLAAMGRDPVSLDQIAHRTGLAAAALGAQLSLLEIAGDVAALPGGRFQRLERAP